MSGPPKFIGHHEVICLLGEGGMAEVYLAFARGPASVRKLVVIKRIRDELAHDSEFISMFLDEARLAAQLNHPNVVQTYEVGSGDENYSLTMEYLEGQSFEEILKRIQLGLFPLEEHLWILTQVLAGLQYAHALADYSGAPLGVVHRDVSPANIFVTYNGDVKLLDFGVARACGAICVTEVGIFKGKISCCAPEQLQDNEPPDARADIYAVGILLWEALAGRRLGSTATIQELVHQRRQGRDPKIREVRPDVDPALADICDRAMAFKPAHRYLTAADFQRDLERYLEKIGSRVGRSHIAELMKGHFEAERRAIQKRIEEHLAATQDSEARSDAPRESPPRLSPDGAAGALPTREVTPQEALTPKNGRGRSQARKPQIAQSAAAVPKVSPAVPVAAPTSNPLTSKVSPPMTLPVPSSRSAPLPNEAHVVGRLGRGLLLLALAVVVGGGIVGGWKKLNGRRESRPVPVAAIASTPAAATPEPSPPPPPTPTTPPPAEQPIGVTESEAPPAGDTIRLDIRVRPASASLALDDNRAQGSRLQADVNRDGSTHVVTAFARGYLPFKQAVTFTSDVVMDVELKRGPRPASKNAKPRAALVEAEAKARSRPSSKGTRGITDANQDVKDRRPSATKPTSEQSSEPGSNLERPDHRRRGVLDESDPYTRPEDPFEP